jgi:hypothetical protein
LEIVTSPIQFIGKHGRGWTAQIFSNLSGIVSAKAQVPEPLSQVFSHYFRNISWFFSDFGWFFSGFSPFLDLYYLISTDNDYK